MAKKNEPKVEAPEAAAAPAGPAQEAPKPKAAPVGKGGLSAHELEEVWIEITHPVKINGEEFFGRTKMPRHQAESIAEMLQKKIQADMAAITGKNYIQRFLPNGDRIISPVVSKQGEE